LAISVIIAIMSASLGCLSDAFLSSEDIAGTQIAPDKAMTVR
jgi:hypothetical protein